MNADQVKALLALEPNPSCGFTTPTYSSPLRPAADYPAFADEVRSFGAPTG